MTLSETRITDDADARTDHAPADKIVARRVGKTFPARKVGRVATNELTVLRDFELAVPEGEFLALLGPSGCGKSTFLNILAGLETLSDGEVLVGGEPLTGVNRDIGVVFQGYALYPWRSVLTNVEAGLEIRGVSKSERRRIATELLEKVGLGEFLHSYPHQLSGGMRQRVAIVRALAYDPSVLVMDEPFAALDANTRELLQLELLRIWGLSHDEGAQRKTVLFVTHSIDEAVFLADRVAIMTARPGRVKALVDIDLPRPRTEEIRNSPEFVGIRRTVAEILRDEVRDVA
ncbi:ABC transporter ATP-binding protein [Nocardia jinanensis]|uniref:ABC transporter ATP-binding protein n=1 Tax=Nocardia jinanensis TaxID=382504 RepID=A0A917RDP6_9NOCA|nr:ABC transporter ATP-binding protein [Nocardia jinanensis]GGL03310.1 ABC transporter ATP-binding protein [Nocardia jinanensis]